MTLSYLSLLTGCLVIKYLIVILLYLYLNIIWVIAKH